MSKLPCISNRKNDIKVIQQPLSSNIEVVNIEKAKRMQEHLTSIKNSLNVNSIIDGVITHYNQ